MKSALLLTFMLAAAALAEVPAHSVVGSLTIDVTDVQIPVGYGTTETKAVIAACSDQQFTKLQIVVASMNSAGVMEASAVIEVVPMKVGSVYCISAVAPTSRTRLTELHASTLTQIDLVSSTALPSPATSESKAAQRR